MHRSPGTPSVIPVKYRWVGGGAMRIATTCADLVVWCHEDVPRSGVPAPQVTQIPTPDSGAPHSPV